MQFFGVILPNSTGLRCTTDPPVAIFVYLIMLGGSVVTCFHPNSFPVLAHGISSQETKKLEIKTCNGFKTTETLETLGFMKNYTCSLWASLP